MAEATPRAAAAAAPIPDDASVLADKQKELSTVSAQLTDATTRATTLSLEIKALQARIDEVKKSTDAYSVGVAAQQKDLDDLQKLIDQKSMMAVAGVKAQKDAIDRVIKLVDDDIAAQSARLDVLQRSADKAAKDSDLAALDLKAKQDAYAGLQQAQKVTDAQIKDVKNLIDQASKAEAKADVVSMYFLLQEASTSLKSITILSAADYTAKVKAAQADVESSKANQALKKQAADQQSKQLSDAQSSVAAAVSARRQTILDKLKDIQAVPAAAPPAPVVSPTAPLVAAADTP